MAFTKIEAGDTGMCPPSVSLSYADPRDLIRLYAAVGEMISASLDVPYDRLIDAARDYARASKAMGRAERGLNRALRGGRYGW